MARCLIIGTSNSIRQSGFRPLLAALRPDIEVSLAGVGGSPSILLPYILERTPLTGVGHVVIDTLVNDSGHTSSGWADPALCEMALLESIAAIKRAGIPVTLLLMPQRNMQERAQELRARRLAIAAAQGLGVVDGYVAVEQLRERFAIPDARLFDDVAHASWPVNLLVARRLAAALGPIAAPAADGLALPYIVRAPEAEGAEIVERSTSLAACRYVVLREGASARITLDEPGDLLGIALNTARASGFLRIETEGGALVKDLRTETDGPGPGGREMVHMIAATMTALRGRSFTLSMHAAPPEGAVERTKLAGGQDETARGEAEIEALIFRNSAAPAWTPPDVAPADPVRPALGPEEEAIGMAAMFSFASAHRSPGAQFFRTRIATEPPIWERKPPQIARLLVELGDQLGDPAGARRLRRMAAERFPKHPSFGGAGPAARRGPARSDPD